MCNKHLLPCKSRRSLFQSNANVNYYHLLDLRTLISLKRTQRRPQDNKYLHCFPVGPNSRRSRSLKRSLTSYLHQPPATKRLASGAKKDVKRQVRVGLLRTRKHSDASRAAPTAWKCCRLVSGGSGSPALPLSHNLQS